MRILLYLNIDVQLESKLSGWRIGIGKSGKGIEGWQCSGEGGVAEDKRWIGGLGDRKGGGEHGKKGRHFTQRDGEEQRRAVILAEGKGSPGWLKMK